MTTYDINPAGVQQVLTQVQTDAEGFETVLAPLNGHLESIATATGGSGAILPALEKFFEVKGRELEAIVNRISAGMTGAVNATNAYNQGDLDMIADYQQQAYDTANGIIRRSPHHGNMVMY